MTKFELLYLCLEPLLPPLHRKVRKRLALAAKTRGQSLKILDVGGRKSHYTINIPAGVIVTDLPRETDLQKQLNLGITTHTVAKLQSKRSNLDRILYDDMTRSRLPSETFDCVVAVEVLEHVEADHLFIEHVFRVLKPGGFFLMTTPNGDSVKNTNPDHKRHYKREQLHNLLVHYFGNAEVEYAIKGGRFRTLGLRPWSPRRPLRTVLSFVGNVVNSLQSASDSLRLQAVGTRHLIATADKRADTRSTKRGHG